MKFLFLFPQFFAGKMLCSIQPCLFLHDKRYQLCIYCLQTDLESAGMEIAVTAHVLHLSSSSAPRALPPCLDVLAQLHPAGLSRNNRLFLDKWGVGCVQTHHKGCSLPWFFWECCFACWISSIPHELSSLLTARGINSMLILALPPRWICEVWAPSMPYSQTYKHCEMKGGDGGQRRSRPERV